MASESERRREVVVGLFVLGALVVTGFMVFQFGAEQRIFEKRIQLRAVFGDVSGLRGGAPVFVSGLNVGTVERLRFVAPGSGRRAEPERPARRAEAADRVGEVEVLMNVEARFRAEIRQDSVATIGSVGLLGDKSIEISVGSVSEPEIEPGGILQTVDPMTISDIMDEVQPMAGKLEEILGDIAALTGEMSHEDSALRTSIENMSHILEKVDRGEGTLGQLVNSPSTVDELNELLKDARGAVAQIRAATTDLPPTMASVRKVAEDVATLSVALRESAAELPGITRDVATITRNLSVASQEFPELSVGAEQGIRKATDVFDAAGQSFLLRGYMDKTPRRLPAAMGRTDASLEALRSGAGGASGVE